MIEMAHDRDSSGALAQHAINNALQAEVVHLNDNRSRKPLECTSIEDVAALLKKRAGTHRDQCLIIAKADNPDETNKDFEESQSAWLRWFVYSFVHNNSNNPQESATKILGGQVRAAADRAADIHHTARYNRAILQLAPHQGSERFVSLIQDQAGFWWMVDARSIATSKSKVFCYEKLALKVLKQARAAMVWVVESYPGLRNGSDIGYMNSTMYVRAHGSVVR